MSGEPDRGLMIELIEAMDRRDELATERLSFIASYKTRCRSEPSGSPIRTSGSARSARK